MSDDNDVTLILLEVERDCYSKWDGETVAANFCQFIFDGLMCWPPTAAGVLAKQSCTSTYLKTTKNGVATRQCYDNGHWHQNQTPAWSNFSQCGDFYIEKVPVIGNSSAYPFWIPILKNITHFGYVISILSIIIALTILILIKKLHCARNNLHINLFFSFIMRALMSLIKDGLFLNGTLVDQYIVYVDGEPTLNKESTDLWMCKILISLWHYFIMTNYVFLLMEGSYLHNLMFLNLFAERGVIIYCVLGWCLPLVFIIPWVTLRILYDDNFCWTDRNVKFINWFIDIPIGITIVINFLLFIVIIRVLFVKLTSMYIQQRRVKYRKLLKATLILVPLFGIPYTISLILSFHIKTSETFELLWLFFDQSFTAFQGLFASLLYCFLNSEVQVELRRKYALLKDKNNKEFKRNRTISHTQQSLIANGEELAEITSSRKEADLLRKTSDFF